MEDETAGIKRARDIPVLHNDRAGRHIFDKMPAIRLIYKQLLFVWLSFLVMVAITYCFINDTIRQYLLKETENAFSYTQAAIVSDLAEPEMMLKGFAESVRYMILYGYSAQSMRDYIRSYSAHVFRNESRKLALGGVYGVFDVYGGLFFNDGLWTPPADFVPQQRPWYAAAVAAQGDVAATPPYMDVRQRGLVMSYACRIFDEIGTPLAVIAIDVSLEKIGKYVTETRLAEGGFGLLLDAQLNVIAHKDTSIIGKPLSVINSDAAKIMDDLQSGLDVLEREVANYKGDASIAFFRRLENGWHLGILTPISEYYREVKTLAQFLLTLGILLATALSMVLLHMADAKDKADERLRMQRTAESARLTAMAHWYRSILDAIPFPISVTDAEMKWTFINTAVENFLGVRREDVMGQACSKWGASICNTVDCGIACVKRGLKQTCFSHAGSSYQVDIEILKGLHGETTGFIELVQDITKLEQMAKRQMEAESVSQAKSAFLARVSHEVRTPMNAVLGITEIQLQNERLSQDTQDAFGKIYIAGYTLLGIINDILDLSRMEAGKVELLPGKYEIASLINDTVQLNLIRIGDKPIEFKLQVDADMPSALYGDELRIKQILNNLLSNAFKYTQAGEVTLSVAAEYGSGAEDSDVTLVFRMRDTGMGMTTEQVARLFDEYSRFYLEDANRTIEGVGLGMNITRQLVQMMNGEIVVESEPGRGSVFTVRLPQDDIDAGKLGKEAVESLRRFKVGMPYMKMAQIAREPMPYGSVLIVDDLDTNLYVARGLMAPYGLSIDTALSGFGAISKIRSGKEYDIVFMDHMMPSMDGVETTRMLRDMGYAAPIIALTANALVGQAEMFLDNGFNGFISKPVDLRQLDSVLNRLIRDKQPPEVIEAARRQKGVSKAVHETLQPFVDPKLAKIFVRDAEKAVATLERIYTNQYRRDDDMHMFVINVHAMKSALANIGESAIAALAHNLEQAGRRRDADVVSAETPAFLNELLAVIEKFRPKDEDSETVDEDQTYLREKLLAIQAACVAYDKKTAKDALAELQQKAWSRATREQLDTIAEHLLHSEFEEIASVAEQAIKVI